MTTTQTQELKPQPPVPEHGIRGWKPWQKWLAGIGAGVVILGCGIGIGTATQPTKTITKTVTVTKTVKVPGPVVTKTVKVPGPTKIVTKTKTVYVPATAGPAGTTLGTWSGTGNQVTGAFTAPDSGSYIVSWTFSGNVDPQLGQASNFIMDATDNSAMSLGLPNDIAASGSGSTQVTDASGTQSFNVEATGSWTIKVITAP